MQKQRQSNGNGTSDGQRRVRNKLELQDSIVEGADGPPIFDHVNLGLGNYGDDEYWQQIRSYRRGLYLHTAFSRAILKRAIHETKVALGREGYNAHWDSTDEEVKIADPVDPQSPDQADVDIEDIDVDDVSPRRQIFKRGEEIWEDLGDPNTMMSNEQAAALMEKTGVGTDWMPISWEMVIGRHEASRSRSAELIRDVFSEISHFRTDGDTQDLSKLLGGQS